MMNKVPTGSGLFARLKPEGFWADATTPFTYSGPAAAGAAPSEKSIRLLDSESFFDH